MTIPREVVPILQKVIQDFGNILQNHPEAHLPSHIAHY